MPTIVTAARLLSPGPFSPHQQIENPVILIEDGAIVSIAAREATSLPPGRHIDYAGATLIPAYFDVHIHGCRGYDVMEATPAGLSEIGRFLATHGVGSYLATTMTAPKDVILKGLSELALLIKAEAQGEKRRARPVGIHIEGPFLSHEKKGAHPTRDLLTPSIEFFDQMWQASEGSIKLMTIAPELPNALDVISHAAALGVRISIGHSNATTEQARAGIAAGAHSATHTFNAMRPFDHREPGILGVVLTDDTLYAELICDGLHVDPNIVKLFSRAKGAERGILITDAMSAAGMPDGTYKLGELDVRVVNGRCVIGENTLAGSTLTLDQGVRNFTQFAEVELATAVRLATANPAGMIGLGDKLGALAPGRAADITVLSAEGHVLETLLAGEPTSAS